MWKGYDTRRKMRKMGEQEVMVTSTGPENFPPIGESSVDEEPKNSLVPIYVYYY